MARRATPRPSRRTGKSASEKTRPAARAPVSPADAAAQAAYHRRTREDHAAEIAQDYVEAIADLIEESGEARVVDLAKRLGVSHVTVVRTLARLKRERLVVAQPYRAIFLTDTGRAMAENARSRHRTVLGFLRTLGVPEEAARADAEGIEHHVGRETLEAIEKFAGRRGAAPSVLHLPSIVTERLTLVPGDPAMVRAAARSGAEVGALLGAHAAPDWPPPLIEDAWEPLAGMLESEPSLVGWAFWFIVKGRPSLGAPLSARDPGAMLIGTAGFKGPPTAEGDVETGYGIVVSEHRRGYATEATGALIRWAFSRPGVARVIADTLPDHEASLGVMRKCGMTLLGPGPLEEGMPTVRYAVCRPAELPPPIRTLHHAQVMFGDGALAEARRFYCEILGLPEILKARALDAQRPGGFWVRAGDRDVHLGVDAAPDGATGRRRSRAHLAYTVTDLAAWRGHLERHGVETMDSVAIPGHARCELRDPFGNRVELIEVLRSERPQNDAAARGT